MLKTFKLFALIISLFSIGLTILAQEKIAYSAKPKEDFKILAQGNYSKVENPFVFVARDAKTYAQLQNLAEGLPAVSSIDFKKKAVVAGFAGERSTGGWSVEMRKTDKRILLDIKAPDKDMMVMQVISYPFKVSLIPLDENEALPLDLSTSYTKNSKTFQVKKGDFEYSGGIAGIRRKFQANGTIQMLTFGDYATVLFNLQGMDKEKKRQLSEMASGIFKAGQIELFRLDAGNFADSPRPPFTVKGTLKDKMLSLNFAPLPVQVADGFQGKGILEAMQIK